MNIYCWIPENWGDIAAIAQTLECVIVFVALIYAASQLKESTRARKLQSIRESLNEIGTPEIRNARNWVLENIKPNDRFIKKKYRGNKEKINNLAVAYDRVGLIIKLKLIPEKEFFEFQGKDIEQLWDRLKPIIYEIRESRPQHCLHFEYLATTWLKSMKS